VCVCVCVCVCWVGTWKCTYVEMCHHLSAWCLQKLLVCAQVMGLVEIFFSLEKLLLNIDVLGICRPKLYNSKAIFTGTSLLSFSPLRMPNFVHCQLCSSVYQWHYSKFFCNVSYGTLWKSRHAPFSELLQREDQDWKKSSWSKQSQKW
jgi:hypothetical protein